MAYNFKNYIYNDKLSKEQNLLMDRLYKLRMSGMAETFERQLLDPNQGLNSFEERFSDIVNSEWSQRETKKFNKLLMTGGAGAGKTYIACALCVTALHQMRTVKYIRSSYLLQEADHARKENSYYEYSNKMASYDLLVIDDFGLMDLDVEKCRDLLEVIEARDSRKSTIIISQIPVEKWYQLFGDNTYADACLSRMTAKAYRLHFPGSDRRISNK